MPSTCPTTASRTTPRPRQPIDPNPLPPSRRQRRSPHEELRQPGRPDPVGAGHRLPDLRAHRPGEALMSQNVIAVIVLVVLLAISTPLLGSYMAKVFQNKKACLLYTSPSPRDRQK